MTEITEIEFNIALQAAEKGDSTEQIRVADCYRDGIIVKKDKTLAFEWYLRSALQGNAKGEVLVGVCFEGGIGVEKNTAKAFEWYLKSAEQGFRRGAYEVGRCYSRGKGIGKNEAKAFEWFLQSAEQGFAHGEYSLGNCYLYGKGVEKNETKAFEWFLKSAKQGLAIAEYRIGDCYSKGVGVQKDDVQAFEWYKKGAEHGNPLLLCTIGFCYLQGRGVEKNDAEAFKWFMKSASFGNPYGEALVGISYKEGTGVEKDESEAFKWFYRSANQGNVLGEFHVGMCYCFGHGVKKNGDNAFYWFHKSFVKEFFGGIIGEAICYLKGLGVEQNESIAFELFKKAVKQGNPDVENLIGTCYYEGVGVKKNNGEALEWYKRASEHGSLLGRINTGLLFFKCKEYEKALDYLKNPKDFYCLSDYKFCQVFVTLSSLGRKSKQLCEIVEKIFKDTSYVYCSSIELFEYLLLIDYSKYDQCQKLVELCNKHKKDSGGWAYFFLSIYSGVFDQSKELKGLVEKNNVLSYVYRRRASEYGFPFNQSDVKKYYSNTDLIDDYEMADAKIEFDRGIDTERLGRCIERQCRKYLKTDNLTRIMEEMVGFHSLMDYMFLKTERWDMEKKPEFSLKIRNDINSVGGSRRRRIDDPADEINTGFELFRRDKDVNHFLKRLSEEEQCSSFNSLSEYIDSFSDLTIKNKIEDYCFNLGKGARERVFNQIRHKAISFGDVYAEEGVPYDYMDSKEKTGAEKIDDITAWKLDLITSIEKAIAMLEKDSGVRKCKKATASYIIASFLYTDLAERILEISGQIEIFDELEEEIKRILGRTESFNYNLNPLFQLFKEKKGDVRDLDICELIGVKPSSYARTKKTIHDHLKVYLDKAVVD